ncbi:MAG: acyl carrier protein [Bacilli bacterium]|nr:acyl carrier protein [Bacilli bacterium]
MNRSEILEKLKGIFKIVVNNGVNVESVKEQSNIALDLGVNSIGQLYMAIAIEKEFNVDMSDVAPSTFKTVSDVIDYIEKH